VSEDYQSRQMAIKLSIIIPAYNEREKIGRDVKLAGEFLASNDLDGEIIVVDDGSNDDTSAQAKAADVKPPAELRLISCPDHHGKGYAVKMGMIASRGEYAMFADSGGCVPYDNALPGLEMLERGECDIAHASRKLAETVIKRGQPLHRRVFSKMFRFVAAMLMDIPRNLTDTQCGFKIYRGQVARHLYGECVSEGFMFDVEIISRARRAGYIITEFPIQWTCDPDSRLSVGQSPWQVGRELLRIRRILKKEKKAGRSVQSRCAGIERKRYG